MSNLPAASTAQTRAALPENLGQPLHQAITQMEYWQQCATQAGLSLRPPPPTPISCCGRGCNGCVWEGFFDAVTFWIEDAQQALNTD